MSPRPRTATVSVAVAAVGLVVVGVIGMLTHQPWVFPSLGPTLMVLGETPDEPAARPRNVVVGHLVGIAAGWIGLAVTGLLHHPSVLEEGLTAARVAAAVVSLVLTTGVLVLLDVPHPPAGATTLIVSLGILSQPVQLLVIAASVVVCLVVALAIRGALQRALPAVRAA